MDFVKCSNIVIMEKSQHRGLNSIVGVFHGVMLARK